MGYWGEAPWDNDYAADWFHDVFRRTKIHEVIEKSLRKRVDDNSRDEVRGAITLFLLLGRGYVYDIRKYEEHLELCITKNKELQTHLEDGGWDGDPDFERWLGFEREVLERRKNYRKVAFDKRPGISPELRDWWAGWID